VGMGVLPLQFKIGENRTTLGLYGDEFFDILNLYELAPNKELKVSVTSSSGKKTGFNVMVRLDSIIELAYYQNGGILQYVLRNFLKRA
jgi:aconitate hydratase